MYAKVQLIGRLGRDPESRSTGSGDPVCNFSVATDHPGPSRDGEKTKVTEWHNVVAFRKLADVCAKYLKKGMLVFIEGDLQYRSWEKDGAKHTSAQIICNTMKMLERKSDDGYEPRASAPAPRLTQSAPAQAPADDAITDDDIPF